MSGDEWLQWSLGSLDCHQPSFHQPRRHQAGQCGGGHMAEEWLPVERGRERDYVCANMCYKDKPSPLSLVKGSSAVGVAPPSQSSAGV